MLILFVFVALALLIVCDHLHKKHRIDMFDKSNIRGPKALPLLGCGLETINLSPENMITYVSDKFQKYGKTFRMWILNEALIFTIDIKHFETILNSTTLLRKGDLYQMMRSFLNDGLLLSVGQKWHARRKSFTPAFHFNVLEHYVSVFDEQSSVMVKKLEKLADGETVIDMLSIVCLAALDVITETAMGVKVNAQLNAEFPYVKALKNVVYAQPDRMFKFTQRYDWIFKLTAPKQYNKILTDIRIMHDFTMNIIETRRAELERSKADGTYKPIKLADDEIGTKQQMAFLDILLQSSINGKPLSNEDIREEVDTFIFEGDDTTTSAISHALYSIARHPNVQQKLLSEIHHVIGMDKDAPITMKHLQELKYTECVIKETLRLYPSVPAIGRKTDKDINIGGAVLPANTSIYLVTYFAHRNPEYFADPESFIPERFDEFSNNELLKRNTFAYTPFSAGPKNCIGQKFAMLEMKTMITKVLRYFELLPLGCNIQPMMNFILRSHSGINVGLKPRIY